MLSFKITAIAICALLPALSFAAYIQPEARFGPPSGTPACMRQCPVYDSSIGQTSNLGSLLGNDDGTNTLCRYTRIRTFAEVDTPVVCRYNKDVTVQPYGTLLTTSPTNVACPATLSSTTLGLSMCGTTGDVTGGVSNAMGFSGSVRLVDGAGTSRPTFQRCIFRFTRTPTTSNVRCYYNSLTGDFVPETSGDQCSTATAERTLCAKRRGETPLQKRIRERQYKGPLRRVQSEQ